MSFNGKAVIITGSSSGIGQAAAVLFAKEGAFVTIHGRNEENLNKTIKLIEDNGGNKDKILTIIGEITDFKTQNDLINKTIEKFGRIDVLVNNAGIKKRVDFEDHHLIENFDYVFNVNLRSVIILTQLALPYLEKTKGNIINISSISAIRTTPGYPYYGMSKAALDQFTRNYAALLGSKGIRVNNINPGFTDTEFNPRQGVKPEKWKEVQKQFESIIPLGRWAESKEIAEVIVFVASDKASYLTGQCVKVDGGVLIGGQGPQLLKKQ